MMRRFARLPSLLVVGLLLHANQRPGSTFRANALEKVLGDNDTAQDAVPKQLVMHSAIGWPVESQEEAEAARGGTSPFLLSEGRVQSLCCAELYVVGGVLERPEDGARRFCAAARDSETRKAMRSWGVATIILDAAAADAARERQRSQQFKATGRSTEVELNGGVDDVRSSIDGMDGRMSKEEEKDQDEGDPCVQAVSMVLSQRERLLELWGSLVTIPTWQPKTQTQVDFSATDVFFSDTLKSLQYFCAKHSGGDGNCIGALGNAMNDAFDRGQSVWNSTSRDHLGDATTTTTASGSREPSVSQEAPPLLVPINTTPATTLPPCVRIHGISENAKGAGAFWRASEWLAEGLRRHPRIHVVHGDNLKGYPLRNDHTYKEESGAAKPTTCNTTPAVDASEEGEGSAHGAVDWYIYLWMSTSPVRRRNDNATNFILSHDDRKVLSVRSHPRLAPELVSVDRSKLVVIDLQDDPASVEGLSGVNDSALYFKRSWAPRFDGSTRCLYPATDDATGSEDTSTDYVTATTVEAAATAATEAAAATHVAAGFTALPMSSILATNRQKCSVAPTRPPWFRPLPFSTLERYFAAPGQTLPYAERPFSVACLLRPHTALHYDSSRTRVLRWTVAALLEWNLADDAFLGQLNTLGLESDSANYFDLLRHSKIVVTANPSTIEGDHRMWEALAAGALVFVDYTTAPLAHPLIDGVHVVLFDPHDEIAFRSKLWHYMVEAPHEAAQIAARGLLFARKWHRAEDRVEYILSELDMLLDERRFMEHK